ncbi:MAG: helix-turn-helix domain-containing protein [Methanolinea sp.]|nr:helix-turn-helix domain-containing protein [Methanolinea sp.]
MIADPVEKVIRAALVSDEEFSLVLRDVMKREMRISVRELAEASGIAPSSLYKIVHGQRSPNLSTLRAIVNAMRRVSRLPEGEFIGLIAARPVLDVVQERNAVVDNRRVRVREYPVHTMEEAIISALRAEREGAIAIVCAPIVSSVIEQIVNVPVATIIPRDSVQRAIELAARKAWI